MASMTPSPAICTSPFLHAVKLLAVVLLGACAARIPLESAPMTRSLATVIDSLIETPPLQRTSWGIAVRDVASGRMLYAHNAEKHFIPASNTKLVVTLVALGELGPDWRYTTEIHALGGIDTLAATLVVRGSGDPTLSQRFQSTDFAALDSLADQVAHTGVRVVTGDLIVDATRFSDERIHPTWEIGDLPFSYATPVGAFAVAEGTFRIVRTPGAHAGDPVRVEPIGAPELQPLVITASTDTAGARARWDIDYVGRNDTIRITGSLPAGAPTDTLRLAVVDAEEYAARALRAALERAGVRVVGSTRVVRDSSMLSALTARSDSRVVARRESPPVREIIAAILKPSQNWIAEQLLKTLGAERGERGTWQAGLDVEMRYLTTTIGLDSLAFNLRDASGLSAQNLLTPTAILDMLGHAHKSAWAESYRRALPTAGERGATLSNRLSGYQERVFAKTGSIANVNSLSGYLRTIDGREVTFSILTNGSGVPSAVVRATIDDVVRAIAASAQPASAIGGAMGGAAAGAAPSARRVAR
jgi:D-alanyl-D-alanine carboxypeptidase/D-alanyl-D-alanine-endopeptidase (penicillin-binding protein 4)